MSSLNRASLIGNCGKDPDIRLTQAGARIANFSLATSETWTDKASGEKRERTEWHRIVVFNEGLVGVVEKYVNKGSKLYIEGKIQTRKWTDNAGIERFSTEIVLAQYDGKLVLLGSPSGRAPAPESADDYGGGASSGAGYTARYSAGSAPATAARPASGRGSDLDDQIPF